MSLPQDQPDEPWMRRLSIARNGVVFSFRYHAGDESDVLDEAVGMAQDPQSGLTWSDAAALGMQLAVEAMAEEAAEAAILPPVHPRRFTI